MKFRAYFCGKEIVKPWKKWFYILSLVVTAPITIPLYMFTEALAGISIGASNSMRDDGPPKSWRYSPDNVPFIGIRADFSKSTAP